MKKPTKQQQLDAANKALFEANQEIRALEEQARSLLVQIEQNCEQMRLDSEQMKVCAEATAIARVTLVQANERAQQLSAEYEALCAETLETKEATDATIRSLNQRLSEQSLDLSRQREEGLAAALSLEQANNQILRLQGQLQTAASALAIKDSEKEKLNTLIDVISRSRNSLEEKLSQRELDLSRGREEHQAVSEALGQANDQLLRLRAEREDLCAQLRQMESDTEAMVAKLMDAMEITDPGSMIPWIHLKKGESASLQRIFAMTEASGDDPVDTLLGRLARERRGPAQLSLALIAISVITCIILIAARLWG